MTDRTAWVAGCRAVLNVRRLMYQSLIWPAALRHDARGLRSALDAQDVECAANALIDGVGGDIELGGDFLGGEVLIDQAQAVELASAQPRQA